MDYKVQIKTKNNFLSGTDAKIYCRLTDVDGTVTPTIWMKDETNDSFNKGNIDDFKFTLSKHRTTGLKDLYKCQLWRNDDGTGADWEVLIISFTAVNTKKYNFTFDRTVKKSMVEEQLVDGLKNAEKEYKVTVETSDLKNAGTDAKVEISIFGSRGNTYYRKLDRAYKDDFERGATDVFKLEAIDIGVIEAIQLKMKHTKTMGEQWHCAGIMIGEGSQEVYFPLDMWIKTGQQIKVLPGKPKKISKPVTEPDATKDPNQGAAKPVVIKDPNQGDTKPVVTKPAKTVAPVVTTDPIKIGTKLSGVVTTSDKQFAGTDASVDIWFTDVNGKCAGPIRMAEQGGDSMERGQQNRLDVALIDELAEIYKVQVYQDGGKLGDDWHLDNIQLNAVDLVTGKVSPLGRVFKFDKWIKSNRIYESGAASNEPVEYAVRVVTADVKHAGTDDTVFIDIVGSKGRTQKRKMSTKYHDDWEQGQTDDFTIDAVDLGELKGVVLTKAGKNGWAVSHVEVTAPDGTVSKFDAKNQKVSTEGLSVPKTGETKPVIKPVAPAVTPAETPASIKSSIKTKLSGVVSTSDKPFAGTDAGVEIWFTDVNGKCAGPIKMAEQGGDAMERGQKNRLDVNLIDELAEIYKVQVYQDGGKMGDDWHLDNIQLSGVDLVTGEVKTGSARIFWFDKWIKSNRIYEAGAAGLKPVEYVVHVVTADVKHAGTDDKVFIDIVGSKGRTQKRKMDTKYHDDMERGQTDKFKVSAVDLGDLKGVVLYKAGNDGWAVSHVKVVAPDGTVSKFDAKNQKVSAEGLSIPKSISTAPVAPVVPVVPDVQVQKPTTTSTSVAPATTVETLTDKWSTKIPATNSAVSPFPQFEGCVVTSDKALAGTDAGVLIWVTDFQGKTIGPITIVEEHGEFNAAMERGNTDDFVIKLDQEFGELYKISVRQDGTKVNDSWHLDRIELTRSPVTQNKMIPFVFDKWIKSRDITEAGRNGLAPIDYTVRVKTSKTTYTAGTDDNVFINIHGTKGQTQFRRLNNTLKNDFERGSLDTFKLSAINLSELLSVQLMKLGKDEWIVSYVEVDGPFGTAHFNFEDTIVGENPMEVNKQATPIKPAPVADPVVDPVVDPVIPDPLKLAAVAAPKVVKQKPVIKTKLKGCVVTSDKRGAGTDANVTIWLTDSNGKTAGAMIKEEGGDAMERGQSNKIAINLIDQLADVYKVQIQHDGKGAGSDWHLERVELVMLDVKTEEEIGINKMFVFQTLIKANEIHEAGPIGVKPIDYIIRITTSDIMFAGTDGDVYLNMVGLKGRTQNRKIGNKGKNDFERGKTDTFTLTAIDLGAIQGIYLSKKGRDDWTVARVEIDGPGRTYMFDQQPDQKITKEAVKFAVKR